MASRLFSRMKSRASSRALAGVHVASRTSLGTGGLRTILTHVIPGAFTSPRTTSRAPSAAVRPSFDRKYVHRPRRPRPVIVVVFLASPLVSTSSRAHRDGGAPNVPYRPHPRLYPRRRPQAWSSAMPVVVVVVRPVVRATVNVARATMGTQPYTAWRRYGANVHFGTSHISARRRVVAAIYAVGRRRGIYNSVIYIFFNACTMFCLQNQSTKRVQKLVTGF